MSGDHGAEVAVPAALDVLCRDTRPGDRAGRARRGAASAARVHAACALLDRRGQRSRGHGRASAGRTASQEEFLHARRHQPRRAGRGDRLRIRREHRCAARDRAFRARHDSRHRSSRDRLGRPGRARPHGDARPWRKSGLQRRPPGAVRGDGLGHRHRPSRPRSTRVSACSTSARRTSRARRKSARRTGDLPRRRSTTRASSKATRSSPATWTSS